MIPSSQSRDRVLPRPRPRPTPTATTQPYWDAARRHELLIQRCEACTTRVFYPRELCVRCGSDRLEWIRASGRGTVHTFTIARRATHRLLADRVPYPIVIVELEDGPRLTSTVVGIEPKQISVGMPVVVEFEDHEEASYPVFRAADRPEETS